MQRAEQRAASVQKIDVQLKGISVAAEPPIDADLGKLLGPFREKLLAALAQLTSQGRPFKLVEGFRATDRQQWLYGSGRPAAVPYGRPGAILTNADGISNRSKHQGDGTPGTGKAADCYPLRNGQVFVPPSSDPIWTSYAAAIVAQGLIAGHNFQEIKDSPHCELP